MQTAQVEMAQVTILNVGYAYTDSDGWMRANASCTLIKTPENTVIVDTMTPWDGPLILNKLQDLNIKPEEITYVISTHGHSDHNGNNSLFLNAKRHIVGYCVSNKDQYYAHPFEYDEPFIIDPHLRVIPTPGHTNEDVSLVVQLESGSRTRCIHGADMELDMEEHVAVADGDKPSTSALTLVVAGDLFESEEDILKPELWTGNSFQPEVQVKNRLKVLQMADYVIPGHGKIFKVTEEHRKASEELALRYDKQRDKDELVPKSDKTAD